VNAGAAMAAICQGGTSAALGGSVAGGATGGTWSTPAGGTFNPNATTLNATWTPPGAYSGTATLTLTTSGGPCGTTSANKTIVVNPLPTVNAGGAMAAICQGGTSAALGGSVGGGATGGTWSTPAGGTFNPNATTLNATWTPPGAYSGTATLTLTTSGGSCGTTSANKTIVVNAPPAASGVTICQGATGSITSSAACAAGTSATAGPNFAGTGATSGGAGDSWSNPTRVVANDNSHTTSNIGNVSEALNSTNFGFAIPANAIINGIQVTIGRFASNSNSLQDNSVRLIKAGAATGNNNGATNTNWPTSEAAANYGSTSDLWGTTWTAAQINATNFGVALVVDNENNNDRTASVDYVQVTVTYTIPGTLSWFTVSSGGSAIGTNSPFNPVGVAGSGLPNTNTPGTTTFYAECAAAPGCRTAADFVINPLPAITGNLNVCNGTTSTLTGSGTPAVSTPWLSATTAVATVNASGVVTGVSAGTSVITYTNSNGCSITTTVTVITPLISGTLNVCMGSTRQLTGSGTAAVTDPWMSSAPAVATVSNTGLVTGISAGSTTITYTNSNGCITTATVTVNALPVVNITGSAAICAGGTTSLSPSSGGTWVSSNSAIATVTNAGLVNGLTAGTASFTFTQTSTGCSNTTAPVTINALPGVSIAGSSFICAAGGASILSPATGGTWVSSNPAVATVNNAGEVTGVVAGTASFTFTQTATGCISSTPTVTVTSLPSVSLLASAAAICTGAGATLTATNSGGTNSRVYSGASGVINTSIPESRTSWAGSNIILAGSGGATLAAGDIVEVTLNITHSDNDELDIFLVDPSGNRAMLVSTNNGGSGNGYNNGILRTGATPNITTAGNIVITGTWGTEGAINTVASQAGGNGGNYANAAVPQTALTGAAIDGSWQIRVFDDDNGGANGTLVSWSISIIKNIGTGNYTSVFNGPAAIGAVVYTGANNSTATAVVTPPLGANIYTVTTTDASGCSNTSSSVTVTVNPLPVANAITGPGAVCVGSTINLTSNAAGTPALTYTWLSSNTSVATVTNAGLVSGVAAGTAAITYTVTDGNTCIATSATFTVTVNARPTVTFTAAPGANTCAATTVTYTTQPGQSNYIWSIPGLAGTDYNIIAGGTGSTDNTVSLEWLTAGNKTVTVNYTNGNGCTGASPASNTTAVNARPIPTFTATPGAAVCVSIGVNSSNITYTTQAGQSNYIWTLPGLAGTDYTIVAGGIGTGSNTVTVQWLSTGSKTVTVNYNNASGCTALLPASSTTIVNALPVVNTAASSVCVNSTITATPGSAGTWTSSDNSIATIDNSGLITGVSAGTVSFTYTLTATGCSRTSNAVTVDPLPLISPIADGQAAICVNDITQFTNATAGGVWSIINGTGSASVDAAGLVTGLSAGNVTVVYTYSNGICSNAATVPLTVNPIPAVAPIAGGAAAVCVNAATPAFTNATPGGTWSIIGGGGSASVSAGGIVTGLTAGNVLVVYTVDNGTCSNESAVSLTVNALPPVAAIGGGAAAVCVDATTPVFTNATPGGVWSIINGTGTASITAGGIVTGLSAGTVEVAYSVFNGICTNTAVSLVTVNALPVIAAIDGGAPAVCVNAATPAFTNTTAGGTWSVVDGTGSATITLGGVVTGITPGTVTVVYAVDNGTCADEVTMSLTVNALPLAGAITGINTVCAAATTNLNSNASGFGGLTYTWLSSNTTAATANNAGVVTGIAGGTSDITYTVIDGNGCTATSPVFAVTVLERPAANISTTATSICNGGTVSIAGTVTASGAWTLTLSNGATATGTGNGSFNINVSPNVGTTYSIASLSDENCSALPVDLTGSTAVTVNDPIVITTQPAISQTACSGNSVSFTVAATGTGLTYQWRKGLTNLSNGGTVSGVNTATLVLNPVAVGDAASDYNVVITGLAPCISVVSDNASLLVNQAVSITADPITQTLCSGNDVTFSVTATGSGLSYQWRKNGSPLTDGGNVSGANSAVLNLVNLTAADAANYSVTVSGLTPCAPVTSEAATLTVNTAVVITSEPTDDAVCATLPVTFTVVATGSGLTYQWYKGTAPGIAVTNTANISGATTPSLHFNQANVGDIDNYYVVVSGLAPCTAVQSDYAHLSVDQTITITSQPVSQTVCIGSDVTFSVTATAGVDPLIYQWRKAGVDIPGADQPTFTITGTVAGDAGNYDVVITGIAGCVISYSSVVSLTITPLSVGGTVNTNTTVCTGVNSGTLMLSGYTGAVTGWQSSIDGGVNWVPVANTSTSLFYNNLVAETMYRAVVQNGSCVPDTSAAASISFYPVPDAVATASSQTICSGQAISTIVLSGTIPGTTYNWTRNNSASVTGIATSGSGDIGGVLSNATLLPVTVTFTIIPTANGCYGLPVTATVTVDPSPDVFATPSSQTICSGAGISSIALSSTVAATTYTWVRDNVADVTGIAASGSGDISGALTNNTSSPVKVTFTITPTAAGCDGTAITATVLVNPTPSVLATPSAQTICSAGSIASIVLSSGTAGTTYAWTRDNDVTVTGIAASGNGNITGSLTNTTLLPVTVTFAVTPTANGCPGTTGNATVVVDPSPDAIATPSSQTICSGEAITDILLSSTVPATTYTWTRNNIVAVTGIAASGNGNITGALTNTTAAPVTVTFTITPSAAGCSGASITATVVVNPTPNAVATPSAQSRCSGAAIADIVLTSNVSGSSFNWTRNNNVAVTGIAASGSGNIDGTLTNTTNTQSIVTFTITPTANGCPGPDITATATVNPTPSVSATNNIQTVCSGIAMATVAISNPNLVAGTTYSWTRDNGTLSTGNLTGIAASGSGTSISGTLINTTATQQVTVFTITASAAGCSSSTAVTVTVNPRPVMTSPTSAKVCNTATVNIPLTSNITSTYTWVAANNANVSGESTTTQTTGTLSNTLVNTSALAQYTPRQNVVYTVTPTATGTGCIGAPQTVTVTVNPPYNVSFYEYNTDVNSFTICDGDLVGGGGQNDIDLIMGEYAGATLLWQYAIGTTTGPWNPVPGPYPNNGIHDTLPPAPSIFSPMGTYYFRILVDGCPSDTLTLTKTSTLTIDAGGPDNTVCQSGTPSAITLTGATVAGTASTTVGGTWSISSLSPANGSNTGTLSSTAFRTPAQIPAVTYTPPANYTGVVTLVLTSNDPDGNGPCGPLIATRTITLTQAPIVANAAIKSICNGSSTDITLTSVIPSTYTWTVGTITGGITGASAGSGNIIDQVLTNPSNSTAGTVQYVITPTPVNPATCAAITSTITVTVTPSPAVALAASPSSICFGSAATLTATNSGGTNTLVYTASSGTVNIAIPDNNVNGIASPVAITGSGALTLAATDVVQVTLNINHNYDSDLDVFLVDPSGTRAMLLTSDNGGSGNNYTNTVLNTSAPNVIGSGGSNTAPFTGTYRPEGTISTAPGVYTGIPNTALVGALIEGNWTLRVFDDEEDDAGTLVNWSLSITRSGGYASVVTGPASIGAVTYSGANNSTATAAVTPPAGINAYTVTTTDVAGCSGTSPAVNVTVNPGPTLTAATQQAAVCAGAVAQINLAGLIPGSTSTITYRINSGSTQTVTGITADAGGAANFNTILLSAANNGQVLQVTSVTTTNPAPSCSQLFTQNVTLSVNATPTLTGASLQATVCPGAPAQINLTGLVANSTATVTYTINGGAPQTATGVVASAGGAASFNTAALSIANNGQVLQVTGIAITSVTPNCSQSFASNVTLAVNPTPVLSSTLAPAAICSGTAFNYTAASSTSGATFSWTRAAVAGISNAASGSTGNVNEILTNTSTLPVNVTYVYTVAAGGCSNAPGEAVVVTVNPSPVLGTASQSTAVCAGTGAVINLTGLLPSSTSTVFYSIGGVGQTPIAGVVADATGNANFLTANLTAANNGQTLRITGISNSSSTPACVRSVVVITLLSVNPLPSLGGVAQAAAVCVTGPATINLSGLIANSTNNTIAYSINGVAQTPVTGIDANALGNASFATGILTVINNGQVLTVTGITNGTCSQVFSQNVTLAVGNINTWLGINTNWFDAQNWCGGVPTSTSDVLIPGSLVNYPLLNTGTGMVRDITIQNTASVTVSSAKLQVAGNINNSGVFDAVAGAIELNGSLAPQTLSGSMFAGRIIDGLIISNPSGVTVSAVPNDTLNITDSLAFGNVNNVVVNTGDNITLVSRAGKTARVADITNDGVNTGNSFSGKVMIERYIPEQRSWRLLTVPVQAAGAPTFNASWQEGVVNPDYVYANNLNPRPGYGMHISGTSPALGFDPTPMNNASVKYYNPVTAAWIGIPNTLSARVTDSAGYMVFVRGDRSTPVHLNTGAPTSNTVLRASGSLKTNNQVTTVPAGVGPYTVVGNPFASAIDLRKVSTAGNVSGANYVVWDPNLTGVNSVGAYQYFTRIGGPGTDYVVFPGNSGLGGGSYGPAFSINNTIQSSQAFMVQNAGTGTVSIDENAKLPTSSSNVFRPVSPRSQPSVPSSLAYLGILLLYENLDSAGTQQLVDGALSLYNHAYSNDIDLDDAKKIMNFSSENMGIDNKGNWLQIEKRNRVQDTDTIYYKMRSFRVRQYQFKITAANFNQPGLAAFLEDRYLGTSVPVDMNGTTSYSFRVTLDSGAFSQDRFKIVFRQMTALPVSFSAVKAYRDHDYINVDWNTAHESGVRQYEVEKSADGIHFSKASTETNVLNGDRSAAYRWVDKEPVAGFNFYRIRSVGQDGMTKVSGIVKVLYEKPAASITLYPNPVTGNNFNLYFVNQPAGEYTVRLLNNAGQPIAAKKIKHIETTIAETFRPAQELLHGNYLLEIVKPDGSKQLINVMY
jgi:subtilisin-like proprotein convertase family protein